MCSGEDGTGGGGGGGELCGGGGEEVERLDRRNVD